MSSGARIIKTAAFRNRRNQRNKTIHVVPAGKGWAVMRPSASRASRVYDSQTEAIRDARSMARKTSGELIIHRPDGTVREHDSYNHDPLPSRKASKY